MRIIRLSASLPRMREADVLGRQVLRSGTSVGAHREGYRARSTAEFVGKLEGALMELDETTYWLELLGDSGVVKPELLKELQAEADELIAIMVTCVRNAEKRAN